MTREELRELLCYAIRSGLVHWLTAPVKAHVKSDEDLDHAASVIAGQIEAGFFWQSYLSANRVERDRRNGYVMADVDNNVTVTENGFEIESGIPLPPRSVLGGKTSPYPLAKLRVGDSFAVPTEDGKKLRSAVSGRRKTEPGKTERYSVRAVIKCPSCGLEGVPGKPCTGCGKDTAGGLERVRCWRLANESPETPPEHEHTPE